MTMKIMNANAPLSVGDIIFGNDESMYRIEDIVSGDEPLPAFGKSGFCSTAHGVQGKRHWPSCCQMPLSLEKRGRI